MKITKDTMIFQILLNNNDAIEIFENYGMRCIVCNGSHNETLETAAKVNKINLDKLLEELNDLEATKK